MKNLICTSFVIITVFFGIQISFSQTLNYEDEINLQNGWNNCSDSYLDTKGSQKDFENTRNHLYVSTATSNKRNGRFGTRPKNTLKAGETLKAGQSLMSQNGKYILKMQKADGNLCVYHYANGRQGSGVWCSMKYGFTNAKLVMQADDNLVVYDGYNKAKWSSQTHPYFNAKYRNSANKPVKLVLKNDGKLKLYNRAGVVMYSKQ